MKLSNTQILLLILIVIPILLVQATWIFFDARKREEKYYWLWGIFGLMHVPQSLIIYLIVTRIIKNNNKHTS